MRSRRPLTRYLGASVRVPPPLVALVLIAFLVLANFPVTTSIGIDYEVLTYRTPLYQKAVAFLDRDAQMSALASRVVGTTDGAEPRALKLMEWTRRNVRAVPSGFPVVDSHPIEILVRGYGTFDQAADIFSTLAAYAGIPATLAFSRGPTHETLYAFALAEIDGGWRVFDVREGLAFRNTTGHLAELDELLSDPALTASLPPPREASLPYSTLLEHLRVPSMLRPYEQMPLLRLRHEVERWLSLGRASR